MIRFDYGLTTDDRIGNYRGCLEAKAEGKKFFARVDCDVNEEPWEEIPKYLYAALARYHIDRSKMKIET
jgi:hypothetical protein